MKPNKKSTYIDFARIVVPVYAWAFIFGLKIITPKKKFQIYKNKWTLKFFQIIQMYSILFPRGAFLGNKGVNLP